MSKMEKGFPARQYPPQPLRPLDDHYCPWIFKYVLQSQGGGLARYAEAVSVYVVSARESRSLGGSAQRKPFHQHKGWACYPPAGTQRLQEALRKGGLARTKVPLEANNPRRIAWSVFN